MNGEILNIKEDNCGVILADDGNRYTFTKEDLNEQTLKVGQKVNFVIKDGVAKDIFIVKSQNNSFSNVEISGFLQKLDKNETRKGAVFAAFGVGISFFAIIPFIGTIFLIGGIILELFGVYKLSENSKKEKNIFKNMIMAYVFILIGTIAMTLFAGAGILGGQMSSLNSHNLDMSVGMSMGGVAIGIIVYLVFGVLSIMKMYKSLNSIGIEYNVDLMRLTAKVYVAGILLVPVFGIGFIILLAYNIMKILSYLKIEK